MKVIKNITAKLSPDDLKQIIIEYMKSEGYEVEAKNITFDHGIRWVGYGPSETTESYFAGCAVKCSVK